MKLRYKGKIYRIDRNFYRKEESVEVVCETDGTVADDPLAAIRYFTGGLSEADFCNTLFIRQAQPGAGAQLGDRLRDYLVTREQTADLIKERLVDSKQIKDPVVTVEFMNLGFSVLGEVSNPGRYAIDRDKFTILDALSRAGDLTIDGQRENVTLLRNEGGRDEVYQINLLNAQSLYSSPAFYVQQGDIIYVTPNERRQRESTINGNTIRSTSFWISLSSLATSVAVLVINSVRLSK
jgi:hypothetical protein